MNVRCNVLDLIGHTPLLRLGHLAPDIEFYGKCEFTNQLSVKDRVVLQIIEDAEADGRLKPGSTLIECTSGNTGIAVAYIGTVKGYRSVLVMSEIQSIERRRMLTAFGAELVLTPASEGTAGARAKLHELLAQHPDYFYVGQHTRPSNPSAHYLSTGPEIWTDTDGRIDVLIAGLGTGGTLCGAGRYLKERKPSVKIIGIEPKESPYISQGIFRPHLMMGTAPGFVPETLDREILDEILLVSVPQAFQMCRSLARKEGILVGISSGAVCHAALELARRPEMRGGVIVGVLADSGRQYLSVEGLFY
ncbi:MAG: PLP-dependent cysteine synthase family protein [Candidatus Acidiferrales bacterium]